MTEGRERTPGRGETCVKAHKGERRAQKAHEGMAKDKAGVGGKQGSHGLR